SALHLVEIAVRKIVFVEEAAVLLLHCEIDAPEISLVLIGWIRLRRVVNHTQLEERGVRRLDAGQVEQPESNRLEHSLLAAMPIIALLNARAQVEFGPAGLVFAAIIVARLQIV